MAAASLDVNFKEELSAIEQCELLIPQVVSFLRSIIHHARENVRG